MKLKNKAQERAKVFYNLSKNNFNVNNNHQQIIFFLLIC